MRMHPGSQDDGAKRPHFRARRLIVLGTMVLAAAGLLWRTVDLQTTRKPFLEREGDVRYLRVVEIPAHRGVITDRGARPLAISTPVDSIWANPQELAAERKRWPELTRALGLDLDRLHRLLAERIDREFVYLKRHVEPRVAERVSSLALAGVYRRREYRRYYPAGEVTAHVVGFTDVDDKGLEGMELAYDDWLRGIDGAKRVIQDRLGRIVEDVESIKPARAGRRLTLSLDLRIQDLAYRALKAAVRKHRARAGSAVVLDARTGEVLAMVNQPSYNPNNGAERVGARFRNRAVTDVFEPGSTVKPFTIASALETNAFRPGTMVDTSGGMVKIGRYVIRDPRDYGVIDVSTVIKKSSNVGASKIALEIPPEVLWRTFSAVGFGAVTGSGFPGESAGILTPAGGWGKIQRATLAFGYGLSVTPLQLAQAYAVIANEGMLQTVSFQRLDAAPRMRRVMPRRVARQVRRMLLAVVSREGTGYRARIKGYRVAGKTGTVRKSARGGYAENRYFAVFAGMAPASDPRLVMVVVIDEPQGKTYYGGQVAAPIFSEVMGGALRRLGIAPDDRAVLAGVVDLSRGRAVAINSKPGAGQ